MNCISNCTAVCIDKWLCVIAHHAVSFADLTLVHRPTVSITQVRLVCSSVAASLNSPAACQSLTQLNFFQSHRKRPQRTNAPVTHPSGARELSFSSPHHNKLYHEPLNGHTIVHVCRAQLLNFWRNKVIVYVVVLVLAS